MSNLAYNSWAGRIRELAACVRQLEPLADAMHLSLPRERGWYGELFQKLVPQIDEKPVLVVAVVGGTNTGKSTLFNYLVGSMVSKTDRNATYTKHPVCVVPQGLFSTQQLQKIFADFHLKPWQSEDDAVIDGAENVLIVREDPSGQQSKHLILLDTPDMDGIVRDNWRRAEQIRNAADVLVCMFTPEKHADHAVLTFLKPVAQSDKTFVAVFNKIESPEDCAYFSGWLEPLAKWTGITPHYVYYSLLDRNAAQSNQLPVSPYANGSDELRHDLADLKFSEIKLRSLRGSLRVVLDAEQGIPAFLRQLVDHSQEYTKARDFLHQEVCNPEITLPSLPSHVLWEPIWQWLEPHRTTFDRLVHSAYSRVGRLMTKPFRPSAEQREQEFRSKEWEAYHRAIRHILDKMRSLRELGNDIVQQAVQQALSGMHQELLFTELRAEYENLPLVSNDFRQHVHQKLDEFQRQHPSLIKGLKYTLVATAVLRPAITIGLFAIPGTELAAYTATSAVTEAAAQAAQHTMATVGVDIAVAVAGQGVAEGGPAWTLKQLLAHISRGYYQERTTCLIRILDHRLASPMLQDITRLAHISGCDPLLQAEKLLAEMQTEVH